MAKKRCLRLKAGSKGHGIRVLRINRSQPFDRRSRASHEIASHEIRIRLSGHDLPYLDNVIYSTLSSSFFVTHIRRMRQSISEFGHAPSSLEGHFEF